jgi:hypothetical protein
MLTRREPAGSRSRLRVAANALAAFSIVIALPSAPAATAADESPEGELALSPVPDPDELALAGKACPPSTAKPGSGPLGYRLRGALCEGLYESPVAADFEVVSLLSAGLSFGGEGEIAIGVPDLPGVGPGTPVRVTAVALRPRTYYRMDATVRPGDSLRWPVGEVLGPLGLGPSDLGVFGQVEIEGQTAYVPLRPLGDGVAMPEGDVELVVRAGVDVETVAWRSAALDEPVPRLESRRQRAAAGEPIRLALRFPKPGLQRVEVQLKPAEEDDWLRRVVEVAVPEPR